MGSVVIIGGGVAGLSAASLLARSGRQVTLFEASARVGGLCAGWQRGGYHFNGCLHWVLGARPGSSFHRMWQEVCDIDGLRWVDHEERVRLVRPGGEFHYYNDQGRLREELLALAGDDHDRRLIGRWLDDVATISRHLDHLPPYPFRLAEMPTYISMSSLLPVLLRWRGQTTDTFGGALHSERLRDVVTHLQSSSVGMLAVLFGQSYLSSGVASYPVGGSEALTGALLTAATSAGARVVCGAPVRLIEVRGGRACGVRLCDGTTVAADAVLSCADYRWTHEQALEGRFLTRRQRALLAEGGRAVYHSYCRVFLGVAAPLDHLPHMLRRPARTTLPDGSTLDQMEVEVVNYDATAAPPGHCCVTVNYITRRGAWWIDLRRSDAGAYARAKEELLRATLEQTRDLLGGANVEAADVVTPATYERFAHDYLGSSQGWQPATNLTRGLPIGTRVRGLKNFAQAGQWIVAGGGLPVALKTALEAARAV